MIERISLDKEVTEIEDGDYTITPNDSVIICKSGTFTVTLPTATGIKGRVYDIKNAGAGVITVDADGGETIDTQLTQVLSTQDNLEVMSDGTNWIIL